MIVYVMFAAPYIICVQMLSVMNKLKLKVCMAYCFHQGIS